MITIGLDEVGRGCWAGPLLAAAVALDPARPIPGLNDSKKLSRKQRKKLYDDINAAALAIGVGWVWPVDIDTSGITTAVKRAMADAYRAVATQLSGAGIADDDIHVIIDGNYNFLPAVTGATTLVGADGTVPEASAASIIAKVTRDRYMSQAAATYPEYGFEKHVGYGTAQHIAALEIHGVTEIHRKSYKPIRARLLQSGI